MLERVDTLARAGRSANSNSRPRRQYSRDGVNREQAFAYHVFSAEFLFVAGLAGQAWGQPFSRAYWDSLRRGLRFLRSVRDAGGHVPMVGDADDGIVFRLGPDGEDRAAQLLALGDAVFKGGPAGAAGVRWLLHALAGPAPGTARRRVRHRLGLPRRRLPAVRRRFGEPREIKGMLDCGPLGYLGIAAHGHADALALTLSVAGEQCLVDPGTYSYWQEPKWRDYFRGTSAHNTVRIDGLDQSVSGGRFMWLQEGGGRIERMPQSPGDFDFRGSHDGYLRLADPVRHLRSVRFDAATRDPGGARRSGGAARRTGSNSSGISRPGSSCCSSSDRPARARPAPSRCRCRSAAPAWRWNLCGAARIHHWGGIRAATKRSSRAMCSK